MAQDLVSKECNKSGFITTTAFSSVAALASTNWPALSDNKGRFCQNVVFA